MNYLEKYPYLYEGHMHTSQGSHCGHCTGAHMARVYKAAGYTGIIITDHHFGGNTEIDRSLPWDEWTHQFFSGYRDAKAEGDKIGLKVFCGWEAGFNATEFLIYGLGEEWMKQHPELKTCTVEEQYALVHEAGGMVIHAHPFRKRNYIKATRLFPDHVDGVEGVNATHSTSRFSHDPKNEDELANPKAFEYAKEHNLPTTCGSDMHNDQLYVGISGAGMRFEKPLETVKDFIEAIKSHGKTNDYILTDGERFYSKTGEILE